MNRKFAGVLSTLTLVLSLLAIFGSAASAQGVAENRTDSAIAAAATGTAQPVKVEHRAGGEANLIIPDLSQVSFVGGIHGRSLLMGGLLVCALGLLFGLVMYSQLKRMPVHQSMREISELIYETCKTYLITQGKFILVLEVFIGFVILLYFGFLLHFDPVKVAIILIFSLVGIAGSYGVAWFGIRINTFANSRTAFASLRGKPFPCYSIPLKAGMSIGMLLISVELVIMLFILLFIPGDYAGPCFIGFAIGESLGAAALRIAGGIFTKIADIGADLMKIVFNVKEDDARNPGVIADCTGDNAGDSVGPSADGFETYGVTGVALISFIVLAVREPTVQVQLLVWIFVMRIMMVVASGLSYVINEAFARARYIDVDDMDFEAPLTSLVWLTSLISVSLTFLVSYMLLPQLGDGSLWWKLSTVITCGTLAGAIIPELVKVFTSVNSAHVKEIVTSSREGGASLNILSGFVAGNFSAYWLGLSIMALMSIGFLVSTTGFGTLMIAPAVFAFGLVAFGFLGMGPVTIAVDSYGPVTDNAQSIFELSLIEQVPGIHQELQRDYGFDPQFERSKHLLLATGVHCQSVDPAPAIPARAHYGWGDDLLVHWCVDAGGHDWCVQGRRIHQSEHQSRKHRKGIGCGQQEGGRDLHQVRTAGNVQHLPRRVLRHAGLCVCRAVLLHRLSDFDRAVRAVPGDLHGQRRWRLGQREENRGSGAQAERHSAPRGDGRR